MVTQVYLIMTKTGLVEMRKAKPTRLNSGQVAVKLNIEISDLFFDRFVPEIDVKVADHNVIAPHIEVSVPDRTMEKLLGEGDE